jgi:hypothetical protein
MFFRFLFANRDNVPNRRQSINRCLRGKSFLSDIACKGMRVRACKLLLDASEKTIRGGRVWTISRRIFSGRLAALRQAVAMAVRVDCSSASGLLQVFLLSVFYIYQKEASDEQATNHIAFHFRHRRCGRRRHADPGFCANAEAG